jgi:hypothetical protein
MTWSGSWVPPENVRINGENHWTTAGSLRTF